MDILATVRRLRFVACLATVVLICHAHPGRASGPENDAEKGPDQKTPEPNAERVEFRRDGGQQAVTGRVLIEARNGLLLQSDDGALWTIYDQDAPSRTRATLPFQPATHQELGTRVLAGLPAGFRIHTTDHYVVAYSTSRVYAQWTSSLLERLYAAFTRYWKRQGVQLHEPEFPLVAVVYDDRLAYQRAGVKELGSFSPGIVGYYSLYSNRINMYDLTGAESLRGPRNRRGSQRDITQMLSQPGAVPLVSTIVHEATHQIAFNCGLQTRLADNPLWLTEGLAEYFEAPDLTSRRGWQGIGNVNYLRLKTFLRNLSQWNRSTMQEMLADDRRFRNPRTAAHAYADAWALNYFLIKYRPQAYASYLKMLAAKPPLEEDEPAQRLADFRAHFGNLRELEAEFLKRMSRLE